MGRHAHYWPPSLPSHAPTLPLVFPPHLNSSHANPGSSLGKSTRAALTPSLPPTLPAVHREVCPWRWHLLWHAVLSEAVLPAGPPPHGPGVGHPGGGLPLRCRGLHVTHHCDQDTVRGELDSLGGWERAERGTGLLGQVATAATA